MKMTREEMIKAIMELLEALDAADRVLLLAFIRHLV